MNEGCKWPWKIKLQWIMEYILARNFEEKWNHFCGTKKLYVCMYVNICCPAHGAHLRKLVPFFKWHHKTHICLLIQPVRVKPHDEVLSSVSASCCLLNSCKTEQPIRKGIRYIYWSLKYSNKNSLFSSHSDELSTMSETQFRG